MAILINQVEIIPAEVQEPDLNSQTTQVQSQPRDLRRAELNTIDFDTLTQHMRDRRVRRFAH